MLQVAIKLLHPTAKLPTRKHMEDAGWDLYPTVSMSIPPGHRCLVPTGLAMAIPTGYYGRVAERSSTGSKGLGIGCGVIDATYRGEIFVAVYNRAFFDDAGAPNHEPLLISPEKAIAQIIFERCDPSTWGIVNELPASTRGAGRLGSTDVSSFKESE